VGISRDVFIRVVDSEQFHCKYIIQDIHPLALTDQTLFPDPLDVGFTPYSKQKRQVFQIKMN
jgi:hypothetical protein